MARPRRGQGIDPETMVEVAAEVFATRGFAGATLEEVGRRLGVTRQTVLHHFSTKQHLFQSVIDAERRWAEVSASALFSAEHPGDQFAPLAGFLGLSDESRQHIRLQHVLQGEAIAGNPVAQDFVELRGRGIRRQIEIRVRSVSDSGSLADVWNVNTATTALMALVNGLQALSLVDSDVDVRGAFDAFIEELITKDNNK